MKVIYDIENWKEEAVVATIGFFDGVHPGHRFLLWELRKLADEHRIPSAIITFSTHPRIVLHSDYQPKLLNSFDEKLELLSTTGVDYIIVINFTTSIAALSAHDFITEILSTKLRVKTLLIGYDHRFGFQRAEGFEQYVTYGKECGMEVIKASSFAGKEFVDDSTVLLQNEEDSNFDIFVDRVQHLPAEGMPCINPKGYKGLAVSSSSVRRLILKGDVAAASRLLGYPYRLKGHIVNGYKVGRTIGFPTANIAIDEKFKVIPMSGSYAVWIIIDNLQYNGMLYIGSRPTLEYVDPISIEVNIFDFSEDIYSKSVVVEFVEFIREDIKFDSLDDLREQMSSDKLIAEKLLTIASLRKETL